jgi:hypothetical protein
MMSTWLLAFLLSISQCPSGSQLALGNFSNCVKNGLPCDWEKYKSASGVSLQQDSLGYFVNIKSHDDVQGMSRRLRFNVKDYSMLKWRWKVHVFPDSAREDIKKKNDCAAGIYVAFKGFYPFNHVLKYTWSATLPEGTMLPSPHNSNAMVFVLRSGPANSDEWVSEKRDIAADYQKAFGSPAPLVEGIALQTDSDNTKTFSCADYAEVIASKE